MPTSVREGGGEEDGKSQANGRDPDPLTPPLQPPSSCRVHYLPSLLSQLPPLRPPILPPPRPGPLPAAHDAPYLRPSRVTTGREGGGAGRGESWTGKPLRCILGRLALCPPRSLLGVVVAILGNWCVSWALRKAGCLGEPFEGKWAAFDSCVPLPSSLASDSALRVYDEPANRDVRTLR